MPYLLPPGDAYTDTLRWFLVAVPDKPEYVRAALGAYTDFTKWYIWERDEAKRGADAADAWDEAVAATLEALEMGFPDILLGHIDEVEDLLRGLQAVNQITAQCCDNLGPVNETAETDLEPGGTPPATWGDETVADADDWAELVCGAAHAYVDYLKAMATELETFVTLGAIALGGIAALLSIGAGAGILLKISYGAAATVVSGLIASATVGLFGDVPDDLEAARADIVCEIVHGHVPGMEAAIEASMSALAWSLFYQYVDYASARNIMLEGSHGEENLGVNRRTDCDCDDVTPAGMVYHGTREQGNISGVDPYTFDVTCTGGGGGRVAIWLRLDECPDSHSGGTFTYDVSFVGSTTGGGSTMRSCQLVNSALECDTTLLFNTDSNIEEAFGEGPGSIDVSFDRSVVVGTTARFVCIEGRVINGSGVTGGTITVSFTNLLYTPN